MTIEANEQPAVDTWEAPMLVDAHVHLYDCFDRTTFFDAARANFQAAALGLGLTGDAPGCLMLAETANDHAFESLIAQHEFDHGRWRFHPASEGRSLIAAQGGQDVLVVIAGRQIVTREGLEVLALCCNEQFTDGRVAEHTIEKVIEAGGLPVLPYGVGKWRGARGKLVDRLLSGPLGSRLCLGDNAGRLRLSAAPKQFQDARRHDVWVLPGTDPLPLPGQACNAGRYGMALDGSVDRAMPAASIKRLIETRDRQPDTYGRTAGLGGFLSAQLRMQLRKRLGKRA